MIIERVHPKATIPTKQFINDSGYDVTSPVDITLSWHVPKAVVPLGIKLSIPEGYEVQVRPRSGLAANYGITAVFGTVDNGYRGEIKITLLRVCTPDDIPITLYAGSRIAQLVLAPVHHINFIEGTVMPLTDRGVGGFGHTGI